MVVSVSLAGIGASICARATMGENEIGTFAIPIGDF